MTLHFHITLKQCIRRAWNLDARIFRNGLGHGGYTAVELNRFAHDVLSRVESIG